MEYECNKIGGFSICHPDSIDIHGLALLYHSFAELQRHSMRAVGLNVDGSGLTGQIA